MYPVLELKFPSVITKGRQQIRQNCEGSSPFRFHPFFVTLFFGVSSVLEFMPSSSIPPVEQFTVCEKQQNEQSTRIRQISRVCLPVSITQQYFVAKVVAKWYHFAKWAELSIK